MADPTLSVINQLLQIKKNKDEVKTRPYEKLFSNEGNRKDLEKIAGLIALQNNLNNIYTTKKTMGTGGDTGPILGDWWRPKGNLNPKTNETKPESVISQLIGAYQNTKDPKASSNRMKLQQYLDNSKRFVTRMGQGANLTENEIRLYMDLIPSLTMQDQDFLDYAKRSGGELIPQEVKDLQKSLMMKAKAQGINDPVLIQQAIDELLGSYK